MEIRTADLSDIGSIVELLADDPLGSRREQPDLSGTSKYHDAFAAIRNDKNNHLIVAADDHRVVGVLQLTFIPNMTYEGSWRAQIEGVRVAESHRGSGVGKALLRHAIELARKQSCRIVQLTTDKRRPKALAFYKDLGFSASHEGMKLHLE